MKKGIGILFCFLVFYAAPARAAETVLSQDWYTLQTKHFDFHFPLSLERSARRLALEADSIYDTLSAKFEWKPWGRTQVVLTDVQDLANGFSFFIPYNYVILYAASPRPDEPLGAIEDWLRTVFIHELTHVMHIDQYGGLISPFRWVLGKLVAPNGLTPAWYREGLATYAETIFTSQGRGRSSIMEMILRGSVLTDKFPSIDDAKGYAWNWPGPLISYYFGEKFLEYLAETCGEEKFQEFNRRVSRRLDFFAHPYHARKVFGKTFDALWEEWHADLKKRYTLQEERWRKEGFTPLVPFLTHEGNVQTPAQSHDGKAFVYLSFHPRRSAQIRLWENGKDRLLTTAQNDVDRLSLSPDGKKVVYAKVQLYARRFGFRDLFLTDTRTGKTRRLTEGARAKDPVFFPDGGSILFVAQEAGRDSLKQFELQTGEILPFGFLESGDQKLFYPVFSPGGKFLVVTAWHEKPGGRGQWDLRLLDGKGRPLRWLTEDVAIEMQPFFVNASELLFASDKSGVPNIHSLDLQTGQERQRTHVVTGVFSPLIDSKGVLTVQYFHGNGFDFRRLEAFEKSAGGTESPEAAPSIGPEVRLGPEVRPSPFSFMKETDLPPKKKYSPFRTSLFLPRYSVPAVIWLDDAFLLDLYTGSFDPVRYHRWRLGVDFRTDNKFVGSYGRYNYERFPLTLGTGYNRYSVDFGSLFFLISGRTIRYYEERNGGYVSLSYPFRPSEVAVNYFYEHHRPFTFLTDAERSRLNLGGYAGVGITYVLYNVHYYPASISWEEGRRLRLTGVWADGVFGSAEKQRQRVFSGDWHEYLELPWPTHVLALRAAGGTTWGDELVQGNFTLGGALGERPFQQNTNAYYFPLRGVPVAFGRGSRVLLLSSEYRFPIVSPQRSVLMGIAYFKNFHGAFFADGGDIWTADVTRTASNFFNDFVISSGLELRGDFVINPGIPLFLRAGYGLVVVNRDRIAGLKDPLLKSSLDYGTFIFQTGTAF